MKRLIEKIETIFLCFLALLLSGCAVLSDSQTTIPKPLHGIWHLASSRDEFVSKVIGEDPSEFDDPMGAAFAALVLYEDFFCLPITITKDSFFIGTGDERVDFLKDGSWRIRIHKDPPSVHFSDPDKKIGMRLFLNPEGQLVLETGELRANYEHVANN